jgi:2,5-diamino-6-(ribosylamino)-4(3H)-pyrimidinone 5'-phosphate reductase
MSADGKIALPMRRQTRISNEEDMRRVHELRHRCDAVLVGIGTVLADDPKLTVKERYVPMPRQPVRIVLDSNCRTPKNAEVLSGAAPTMIIVSEKCSKDFPNAEEVTCGDERIDLHRLMEILDERGIRNLLVEGGESVIWSFLNEGLADEMYIFMGSMIIGGDISPTPAGGLGAASEDDIIPLTLRDVKRIGDGVLVHYVVKK